MWRRYLKLAHGYTAAPRTQAVSRLYAFEKQDDADSAPAG
jgi:hypothetical protein